MCLVFKALWRVAVSDRAIFSSPCLLRAAPSNQHHISTRPCLFRTSKPPTLTPTPTLRTPRPEVRAWGRSDGPGKAMEAGDGAAANANRDAHAAFSKDTKAKGSARLQDKQDDVASEWLCAFGCHDHFFRCVCIRTGEVVLARDMGAVVFATVAALRCPADMAAFDATVVAVATTAGDLSLIDVAHAACAGESDTMESGELVSHHAIGGDVYGSPVVAGPYTRCVLRASTGGT